MTRIEFKAINDVCDSFQLLEVYPDIHAWVKDREGRFVHANTLFLQRFGFNHIEQLQGKNDFDLAPKQMAIEYVKDDHKILEGQIITDRLEIIRKHNEAGGWFLTSKWPVYDQNNNIIGTYGSSRHLNKTDVAATPFRDLNGSTEYIQRHFSGPITVEEVAKAVHLSVSALERRFKKHLSKTPRQYIMELRLDHAQKLLFESGKSLACIALESGFSDHSHFTRAFVKRFMLSPSEFRFNVKQESMTG